MSDSKKRDSDVSEVRKNESFKSEVSKDIQDIESSLASSVARAPASVDEEKKKRITVSLSTKRKRKKKQVEKSEKFEKETTTRQVSIKNTKESFC
ncbi:hypothetical protein EBQ74_11120 [bacterium]|nr:hypothetical protein [bacterium]